MVESSASSNLLKSLPYTSTVSSVFQRDHKQFGKKYLFDGKEDTCWNSDQGLPQHVTIKFEAPQKVGVIKYTSQGGFCPKEIVVLADGVEVTRVEMGDSNFEQVINIPEPKEATTIKIEFTRASDLFGRIILYNLELLTQ
ncbi:hypothetical protein FGO68_gene3474 [Halteria grandinella]|uniref:F5/8 type C domain-containing protein n=1 Tax=Halteria grandinella TaxID=5974 RepID=A0A8J8NU79_HALGN|nr:hypothetical protein FGO68_gene3474 [Halteria grandinella]